MYAHTCFSIKNNLILTIYIQENTSYNKIFSLDKACRWSLDVHIDDFTVRKCLLQ